MTRPQLTIEDGPRDYPKELIEQRLQALSPAKSAQWESIVVGPGVKREQLIREFEHFYRFYKTHECPTLKLPPITNSALALPSEQSCPFISGNRLTGGEQRCDGSQSGFTTIQNHGPDMYPDNNGQSVILVAPSFRNGQTRQYKCGEVCDPPLGLICHPVYCGGYSALLSNGMTDKDYWLQVGLYFTNRDDAGGVPPGLGKDKTDPNYCPDLPIPGPGNPFSPDGVGWVVFAGAKTEGGQLVRGQSLDARELCVPYTPEHDYYTTITYTSGTWWTCAADLKQVSTYRCLEHKGATEVGSKHLKTSPGTTNVFFETWSKEANRPWGFPYQLVAYGAKIYVGGIGHPWPKNQQGVEAKFTQHSCKDKNFPPEQAIVKSSGLANDGMAFFNTAYLPPYCE